MHVQKAWEGFALLLNVNIFLSVDFFANSNLNFNENFDEKHFDNPLFS